jgi:hypothetical protein
MVRLLLAFPEGARQPIFAIKRLVIFWYVPSLYYISRPHTGCKEYWIERFRVL